MRFPVVLRSTYEAEVARTAALEQRLTDILLAYTQMHDRLLAALENAQRKPAIPERQRDEVVDAILVRSNGNGVIRAHLSQWAAAQRRANVAEKEIVEQIMYWPSDDEDVASAHES